MIFEFFFKGINEQSMRFGKQWVKEGKDFWAELRRVKMDVHCFYPLPHKLRKGFPVFLCVMHPFKESHNLLIILLIALLKLNLWAITGHRSKMRRNFSNAMILLNVWEPQRQKLQVQSSVLVSQTIKQTTCFCLDYFIWFR